jgi:hypothetical protein
MGMGIAWSTVQPLRARARQIIGEFGVEFRARAGQLASFFSQSVKWEDDPEKRLGLVVPFDCTVDNLRAEAEKALRALAKELQEATIKGP